MKFREIEKLLLDDGWYLKEVRGSHYQYCHPTKTGKITIPYHKGDLDKLTVKSILKYANIK